MRAALLLALLVLPGLAGAHEEGGGDPDLAPPFHVGLSVALAGGAKDGATFGVASSATDGYDRGFDAPEPPAPFGDAWVQAFFAADPSVADGRLHRDFLGPAEALAWELVVEAHGPGGPATLTWDAAALAAIDEPFAFEVDAPGGVVDMREAASCALVVPDDGQARVTLRVERIEGTLPPPPENLTAAPGALPGTVVLRWDAPASDGGSTLRRYRVYRDDEPIGTTNETTFTDADRAAGEVWRYRVAAVNRLGEGEPSAESSAPGTGKPTAARPPPQGNATDRELAAREADVEPQTVTVPATRVALLHIEGGPAVENPSIYRVRVRVADQSNEAAAYTLVPLPRVALDLVDAPGATAQTPGVHARAALYLREKDGAPLGILARSGVSVGDVTVADESFVPLLA